jgi:2-dehydro-3-deoxyphosphogluconate aldolase/(4S)-4-hydroxy-2-oxoglutarate aldolase
MTVKERIEEAYLIPVVVMDDAARAVDTAKALIAGGIKVMEITFRTSAAIESIEKVAKACPDLLVGGGTVLTVEQCHQAVSKGASFIVSPGFEPDIVEYCHKNNIMAIPGCVTPSEITTAMRSGINIIKFFPANVYGGIKAINALSGPFPHIKFVPTGGVDLNNLADFIIPEVFAIGGGWLCDRKMINAGNYEEITRIGIKSFEVVKNMRE